MNFFRTVVALCSGVRVFPALARGPAWRALLHVFLTMALVSILVAALTSFASCGTVAQRADRFFKETGGIAIRNGELFFLDSPDKAQLFTMSEDFRIAAYPRRTFHLSDMQSIPGDRGLFFLPKMLYFWMRVEPDSFQVVSVRPEELQALFFPSSENAETLSSFYDAIQSRQRAPVSGAELCQTMATSMTSPQEAAVGTASSSDSAGTQSETFIFKDPGAAVQIVLAVNCAQTFMTYFLKPLLLIVMTVFFFSLVQYLRAGVLPKRIGYSAALNVSAYAVIPPYLIASLFSVLSLPWPSFDMAFLIAYFLYQMFAYVTVLRDLNPTGPGGRNDMDGF